MRTSKLTRYSIVWIVIVLFVWSVYEAPKTKEIQLKAGSNLTVQGEIYKKEIKEDLQIIYLKNLQIPDDKMNVAAKVRLPVYLACDTASQLPAIGKYIQVTGSVKTLQKSQNPGNFNQKKYYQRQNIHWMLQNAKIEKAGGEAKQCLEKMWQFRQNLCNHILKYMGERTGGILCAMILGETSYMNEEVKENYQKTGIGHLYAVSSLHMNFWGLGVIEGLKKVKCSKKVSVAGGIVFLFAYVIFSGMSISAIRSFIMFFLRMGTVYSGREYDGITAVFLAAAIQLTVNPALLADAGFLLSYGAVVGIYLAGPVLQKRIHAKIGIPLSVQLAILPIMLVLYYEICSFSFVWNLIAVPLASMIMISGALGIICPPFLAVAKWILLFYEYISEWILTLPGARIVVGSPEIYQVAGYYVCVGLFLYLLTCDKKKRAVFVMLTGMCILMIPQQLHPYLEVTMVNVGQGDCFFIQFPTGERCMIDGGSSSVNSVGKYRIEPFLKYNGVGKIDYVFVTHGDEDHLNGILELIKRESVGVKIKSLIFPSRKVWDDKLLNLANTAKEKQIDIFELKQGQQMKFGGAELTCVWPSEDVVDSGNEASMVLDLKYGKFDMLFTGDLENKSEEEVCEYIAHFQKDYEVLKIGHHGSRNGTSKKLLDICKVEAAFVSAGKNNRYGHPHQEVVSRLANRGINRYNTLDGSAVILYTDGEKYYILEP